MDCPEINGEMIMSINKLVNSKITKITSENTKKIGLQCNIVNILVVLLLVLIIFPTRVSLGMTQK